MRYSTLLFDSYASEQAAFRAAMDVAGVDDSHRYFPDYERINHELWAAVERGDIVPDEVRVTRFERFNDQFGFAADPVAMADAFVLGLGNNGELFPGTLDVLDRLRGSATLAMVTNGIGQVQRMRVKRLRLEHYFPVIAVSGELGVAKPGVEIFEWVADQLGGLKKSVTLMVGDSTSSDIQGGYNFGIDTAWYNPFHKDRPAAPPITHEFHALEELPKIVGLE